MFGKDAELQFWRTLNTSCRQKLLLSYRLSSTSAEGWWVGRVLPSMTKCQKMKTTCYNGPVKVQNLNLIWNAVAGSCEGMNVWTPGWTGAAFERKLGQSSSTTSTVHSAWLQARLLHVPFQFDFFYVKSWQVESVRLIEVKQYWHLPNTDPIWSCPYSFTLFYTEWSSHCHRNFQNSCIIWYIMLWVLLLCGISHHNYN